MYSSVLFAAAEMMHSNHSTKTAKSMQTKVSEMI